jgi:3-hydroxyisobutyrate dehydrogenase-like beta-hydroxyacid dehydrogenase
MKLSHIQLRDRKGKGKIMEVGFIGLGQMGAGMAGSLIKAGYKLQVYNRTAAKCRPLEEQGATVAAGVAELCGGKDVAFSCLADDEALEAVAFGEAGLIAALPRGGIHVGTSTISTKMARRLTEAHEEAGQVFVSAPVFGRPEAAAKGALAVLNAGPRDALDRLAPLFEAIGNKVTYLGEDPQKANLAKLAGNFLIGSVVESLGEALALVAKGGVDQQIFLDLLTSTLFAAPVYRTYGQLIIDAKFEPPGFAAPLGAKDVRLTLAAAEELEVPMQLASLLRDRLMTLIATGGAGKDWSALGHLAKLQSGQ